MKNIVFSTNLPSPYRVDFFNELGKYCNLTVLYERKNSAERDEKWIGEQAQNFKEIYLNLKPVGTDCSKGKALRNYIKTAQFDVLVFTNYVSPATMDAIMYCRFKGIPYYIEYDGGFNKKDRFFKRILKKVLLCGARGHLTTADEHKKYLISLGIKTDKIYKYPFTSVKEEDVRKAGVIPNDIKKFYRKKLGIAEEKVVLSVGRFSYENGYGKGYDVLLNVSSILDKEIGIYIVGDEPTEEFIRKKDENALSNVHFIGFKNKQDLAEYYAAADLFILLSRGDVWGLVINEAMTFGLPIITTPLCIAGTELVKEMKNGFLVNVDNISEISEKITFILNNDEIKQSFSKASFTMIRDYTIENMAATQAGIFIGGMTP